MKNLFFSIFNLLLFFKYIQSLFMVINPAENRCISRAMKKDEYFGGFYVSSGENEKGIRVYIINNLNDKLWELEGEQSGSFQMTIHNEGDYSLCVENKSGNQNIFSFEFSEENKDEQALSISN